MLDMHKIASNQLNVQLSPTDVARDILDPVATLAYRRGDDFQVHIDCPDDLAVMTDPIRLKQVILNLTNNARKFVTKGFIRIRAEVVDGKVVLSVEDSGPVRWTSNQHNVLCVFFGSTCQPIRLLLFLFMLY
jgi:hypothetical protein